MNTEHTSARVVLRLVGCLGVAALVAGALFATPAPAAGTGWPIEDDCALCHVKEAPQTGTGAESGTDKAGTADTTGAEASTDKAGTAGAETEATTGKDGASGASVDDFAHIHGAFDCALCHDDAKLAELHEGKTAESKMPKRLKRTEVSEEVCLTCHDAKEIAEATAGLELLTDDKGTVVNPHELPGVKDHDPITCTDCHTMHNGKTAQENAPAKCLSCHHENVYECGTCHS